MGQSLFGIADTISVTPTDLGTDSIATITFTVEDRDSIAKNIAVGVKAKNGDFATNADLQA